MESKGITNMLAILLLLVSMSSPIHWAAAAQTDLVNKVCKATTNYPDCIQALGSDPRTRTATDLDTLATICLDLAVANTTASLGFVKDMAQKPSTSPSLKAMLGSCVNYYQYTVDSFRSAKSDLTEDVMTANYDIKVAIDGPQNCSDDLAKSGFSVPELSDRNKYVRIYSNIGDVITTDMLSTPPSH